MTYTNQHQASSTMGPLALYPYQPYTCAPFNAGPTQPINPRKVVTGYLYCHDKASEIYPGAQLQEVLQSLDINMEAPPPFEAVTAKARYPSHGVVKINNKLVEAIKTKIPFTVTTQEVTQFISRFSTTPMLMKHQNGFPIHVIMEKPTGKTMDCFVEFPSHEAARDCVKRFEFTAQPGRGTKIGNRCVSLDLSNQAELMRAVFPRARFVKFEELTGRPFIMSHSEDPSWTAGFRGYFNLEEIYGMTRFAETPSRSPFVLKCNQRVYESMISTLYKFPWAATQTYTVAARNAIFEAAYKQLQVLSKKVDLTNNPNNTNLVSYNQNQGYSQGYNQGYNQAYSHAGNGYSPDSYPNGPALIQREVGLSQTLLFDLLFAAVNVPAFSLLQKFALCEIAGAAGRGVPLSHLASTWTFQTLAPRHDVPDAVTQFWIQIFDSGFDLISDEGTQTTYEHFINFNRNKIGFPVAEWTTAGVELPFEDGIRVEMAAMMVYINRGRECWAHERGLTVSKWETSCLIDLMESIAREKEAGRHFEAGEPKIPGEPDNNISPTATEFTCQSFPFTDKIRNAAASGPSANSLLGSSTNTRTTTPRFNPATAKDFVPAAARKSSCHEPATNNIYSAFKSLWSDPPLGVAQPSRARLSINANAGDTVNTRGSISQDMPSDPRVALAFRNPFGPPSHQIRGFQQEDPRPGYPHSAKGGPKSSFDSFENRSRKSSSQLTNPTPVTEQMRQMSLTTATASRNNSADTAFISATTSNGPPTTMTDASSYRNSSFTVSDGGSPTPKRTQVQKYPNITYSNVRLDPSQSQLAFGQFDAQSHAQPPYEAGAYANQGQVQFRSPFSPSATDKLRTQSTPFTGYQAGQSNAFLREPPGLEKRGSLPGYATVASASEFPMNQIQPQPRARGGTVTGFDDDNEINAESGTGTGTRAGGGTGNGQLSASELWKQVRGY